MRYGLAKLRQVITWLQTEKNKLDCLLLPPETNNFIMETFCGCTAPGDSVFMYDFKPLKIIFKSMFEVNLFRGVPGQ